MDLHVACNYDEQGASFKVISLESNSVLGTYKTREDAEAVISLVNKVENEITTTTRTKVGVAFVISMITGAAVSDAFYATIRWLLN